MCDCLDFTLIDLVVLWVGLIISLIVLLCLFRCLFVLNDGFKLVLRKLGLICVLFAYLWC